MTIYGNFRKATDELQRLIHENGNRVAKTLELTNVHYLVANPHLQDLTPHQPWAGKEFEERVSYEPRNPGDAWKELPEVWKPMMEDHKGPDGLIYKAFSYTYSERMAFQLAAVLYELKNNSDSREAFLGVWNSPVDSQRLSFRRVPCSLGYQFLVRGGSLNLTYLQRSCNFPKHFQDDCYLALKLQIWMGEKLNTPIGTFSHWIGSLHVFV